MPSARYVLYQLVLGVIIAIWLIPLYAMVINSFKSNMDALSTPVLIPRGFHVSNIVTAAQALAYGLVNSVIVVLPTVVISTLLGALSAFGFYRVKHWLSDFLFTLVAIGTFIPYQVAAVPLVKIMVPLGLFNSYWGLILAYLIFFVPAGALLMSIFISVIPKDYVEMAYIDGASDLTVFLRIVLPLTMPGVIATAIYILIMSWNNFFIPLVVIKSPELRPIALAVERYMGGYGVLYNEFYAAALIAAIVPLVIFILLGRYFIRGLLALGAGTKG
ncbi:glucose ABC transporter permease GlcU [Caldivirga maquilingensis]|uniref:Binding-protein-dependent transport systems inner membrane component n=1 Tax=Caldivirga maquilingensis (strain ATCC 700844 / DSM 13496 / JCM 10307 / IC-167) TaxID=397948 RepID=A8MDK5_CALMQ|nr:glucose ABC transporter permease GlcU [Caldivirga maquilingensis]ABW01861.1 binding-protein-dependent transport systems inner membrane component [Caldivirga maquilingensis IC-167]